MSTRAASTHRRRRWAFLLLIPFALAGCRTAQQRAWDEAVIRCRDMALKEQNPEYGQIWIDCMKRYCAEIRDPGCKSFSQ